MDQYPEHVQLNQASSLSRPRGSRAGLQRYHELSSSVLTELV